jgi:hypothetical protein
MPGDVWRLSPQVRAIPSYGWLRLADLGSAS